MLKAKKRPKLWFYFALIVFAILLATVFIMASLAILLYRFGYLNKDGTMFAPLAFLLFLSVIIGTALSIFVAKIILKPITKFSKAVSEVAKGNFDLRLEESEYVNEIRDLAKNFNIMVRELSCTETLQKDFVDNVSHEFKTPISAIEGYAMLLQEKSLSESERDEYVKLIIDASQQLSSLSENILKLSKLENQELIIDRKAFRLDEQIREAVLFLEGKWSEEELELDIDLNKTTYYGNKGLLMQVWLNLLDNAIKFTPKNGKITILLFSYENNVTVKISDTGRGMKQDEIQRIFEKFYQGDSARKEAGNGLGLALAARIIDLCEGSIEVKSAPGYGSTFTVILPVC